MRKILLLTLFFLLFACERADAGTWLSNTILGKAQPDECYAGPGVDYPNGIAGYSPTAGPLCPLGSVEKTNQTYVWGLTRQGNSLWFGTGPNVYCTTTALYVGAGDEPVDGSSSVCEYGESQLARQGLVDAKVGDVRPPKVYEYDLVTRTLIDRTPVEPLLNQMMGFRSAGSHNGVVFLAGGSTSGPSLIMLAFDADTKQYLGSYLFPYGGTIRKWVVVNNKLYTGMGIDGKPGRIFRWYGTKTDIWKFVVVGTVDGVPREIAEYRGTDGKARIAVTASGLWVSPAIELSQGLTQSTAYWKPVWTPQNYDPDYMTSYSYGGGSLYQFDGWLYWGTMHIPGRGAYLHEQCTYPNVCFGPPQSPEEEATLSAGTSRSTTIWRARNLESTNPEIQLLYGEAELPKFNPTTRTFDLANNVGGYVPLYGSSGFGNRYNSYTWEMQVANGRLFIGTLDITGTDLWRFDSSNLPAVREDGSGFGDYRKYGIRTMESSPDGNTLFCGMASYANLGSNAGWELRELVYPAPTVKLSTPVVSPGAGMFIGTVTVSVANAEIGSSIYYTLDGSEPTQTSNPYKSPIILSETTTVKARAFLGGYLSSDIATASFTKTSQVDTPVISPNGGAFTGSVTVSISDSTPGASIYYTLDDSDPTETSSRYGSPIILTATTRVKAKAFAEGLLPSAIATTRFTNKK